MSSLISERPIGVFDSGMGGLTVLRELNKFLPNESFIYLGDTARLPYGTKTKNTVLQYAKQMVRLLTEQNVKMIVIACNTATVASLNHLQEIYADLPIIGVVNPGALVAARKTNNNNIGLMATETTIISEGYQNTLTKINPKLKIYSQACNLLVSLAEEGFTNNEIARLTLKNYLDHIVNSKTNIDVILLGCTHFPVFKETIKKCVADNIAIVDSAESTAEHVQNILTTKNLLNQSNNPKTIKYFVTDNPTRFARIGALFFGSALENINTIDAI